MHPLHAILPQPARIASIAQESADTRTFVLRLEPPVPAFDAAQPGQFAMLSLLGIGEAAFTFSRLVAAGGRCGDVVLTVRRVGALTRALFALPEGARVGLRGPFGRGFPEHQADVPTVYVAGGCGLTPLKAAIELQLAARAGAVPVGVLYGARDPDTRIHRDALHAWAGTPGVHVVECVEHPTPEWTGARGLVTAALPAVVEAVGARRAAVCGPPAMLAAAANALRRSGLSPASIHVVLERQMKCGYGECGHCYVNHRYVCTDGPVFSLAELDRLPDAFDAPADTWTSTCH
jgi:sulfhydrogenase subunit gamma (sulfur reductase)